MSNDMIWEVKLPSLLNKSSEEVINIVNSIIASNFKELDLWLNEQVENNNLKDFKRGKLLYDKYEQKDYITILDLKYREEYYSKGNPMFYNFKKEEWIETKYNEEVYLRDFRYIIKIRYDSVLNKDDIKISVPKPWFVYINRMKIKKLKTQKNITIDFVIGFKYTKEIRNEELYPNKDCEHEFRLLYHGNYNWNLVWECEKCGFICFCSCFKKAIEGCMNNEVITKRPFRKNLLGEDIILEVREGAILKDKELSTERGFSFKDLNIYKITDIPYYDNACEVCRNKTSSHRYCAKMYARSEFERKYGAYAKKKYIEYKLLNEDINDEDLKRKTNNLTREELGFKKIGERFVTETELYRIIKSIFPNDKVIHHYKAKWLERQEIDIFVPHLNLAIEYDGIQHFKPIKAWGGEEGLKKNIERDKIKENKCRENNVILIRFNYKENDLLSENYVKSKLNEYGINV